MEIFTARTAITSSFDPFAQALDNVPYREPTCCDKSGNLALGGPWDIWPYRVWADLLSMDDVA